MNQLSAVTAGRSWIPDKFAGHAEGSGGDAESGCPLSFWPQHLGGVLFMEGEADMERK